MLLSDAFTSVSFYSCTGICRAIENCVRADKLLPAGPWNVIKTQHSEHEGSCVA
jgi:hypothetical protein